MYKSNGAQALWGIRLAGTGSDIVRIDVLVGFLTTSNSLFPASFRSSRLLPKQAHLAYSACMPVSCLTLLPSQWLLAAIHALHLSPSLYGQILG